MAHLRTKMIAKMIAAAVTWWHYMIFTICRYYISIVGIVLCRHQISKRPYTVDFHAQGAHFRSLIYSSDIIQEMDTQAEEEYNAIPIVEEEMPASEDPAFNVPWSETAANNMSEGTSSSRRRRRRSSSEELPVGLTDLTRGLGDFIQLASTTLSTSFDRLTNELNMVDRSMVERKERLFGDLMKVQGLTEAEIIRASVVIGRDHGLLVQFPSIPDEVKVAWIRAVIQ